MTGPLRIRILAALAAALVVGCGASIGDLDPSATRLARADSAAQFDSSRWRSGNREARGEMLAAFAATHEIVGRSYRQVVDLLGPSECYADYEDQPCYWVRLGGRPYTLVFGVNHSDRPGTVVSVELEERRLSPND